MSLPVRTFWFLSASVDRIRAEQGLQQIQTAGAVLSQDSYQAVTSKLQNTLGKIVTYEAELSLNLDVEFDRSALMALKDSAHTKPLGEVIVT